MTASIPLSVSAKQLYRANGIVQQIGSAANFAGPVIAGMLYGFLGIRWIVVLNAISFFVPALMEGFLHLPEKKNGSRNKLSFLGSVNEMYQGFLYLKKFQSIILKIIFSYGLSNLFIVPVFSVAAPHFIKNVLGLSSEVYGSVEGITVLGMITGGVLISVFPKRFSMAVIHRVLSLGLFNVISLTYMQQAVPGSMIGKTSAFSTAAATATIPPGQFLFGQILESGISVPVLFLFVSAASLGTAYFVKQAIKKN